jgi:hypothetical protein
VKITQLGFVALAGVFIGTLKGDTIDGSFNTCGSQSNTPQTENWRVKRTR